MLGAPEYFVESKNRVRNPFFVHAISSWLECLSSRVERLSSRVECLSIALMASWTEGLEQLSEILQLQLVVAFSTDVYLSGAWLVLPLGAGPEIKLNCLHLSLISKPSFSQKQNYETLPMGVTHNQTEEIQCLLFSWMTYHAISVQSKWLTARCLFSKKWLTVPWLVQLIELCQITRRMFEWLFRYSW